MNAKHRAIGIVVIAAGIAAAHVQYKPDLDRDRVRQMTSMLQSQAGWIGKVAPDFELELRSGERLQLADQVGKNVVVLNFFATWCAPCKKEMPEFERFHAANAQRGFFLVGVDVEEEPKRVDDFLADLGVTFPTGIDEHGTIAGRYGVRSFPTTVVIGASGRVLLYETGAIANADITFSKLLDQERRLIATGKAIGRDQYLAEAAAETYDDLTDRSKTVELSGRAATIAKAMNCTCGCDNKLDHCNCKTAKEIKKKLAAEMNRGGYDKMSDAQVIAALDKEFCIPEKQNDQHH